ncbi:hypothetical protein CMI48_02900 [Candidatus Pacearchaeota archaeon]|nr:hypothetical protein [Candidatus Pacearchaeota archaeon]|tara:strand:+ start:251 stop:544 length:294 start_codon:yes stop_codon:yes gene_type:complete
MSVEIALSYEPSAIQSPLDIGGANPYCGSLQDTDSELIAASCVHESQQTGHWVPFSVQENMGVESMVGNLFAERTSDGLVLTEAAVSRLVEKFPSTE